MNLNEAITQLDQLVAEIRKAALSDDKTPLGNALALQQEVDLIGSKNSLFDVIVFGDLNDFKTLNDVHGHEAGDLAITAAGNKIKQIVVEKLQAKAFRPSGDEFVMLLPQNSLAAFLPETVTFAAIPFDYEGDFLVAKMSFGYAVSDGKTSFSDLQKRAETACQSAKNEGDGVCHQWTREVQTNALKDLRSKCRRCQAKIKCSLPQQNAPSRLKFCPVCGNSL